MKKGFWKKGMALTAAVMMAASLGSVSALAESKTLTVYASLPDYELPTYFNAFEQDTGIKVNYVRLSSGEMLARIESEKDNPQASIMYGGSVDNYQAAIQADLLEPYQAANIDEIPENFRDPEGYWTPISTGAIGFCFNNDWFEENGVEKPKTWEDLLKPEFADQISISHPSTAGTGYMILALLVQMMGEDEAFTYLKGLNENVRQWTKSGSAPASECGLGEAAVGITFGQSVIAVQLEGYNVDLAFPEDGTACEIVGVAMIKNGPADEVDNAKAFIDWCASARAQELYIDSQSGRTPVNPNAKAADGLPKLDELNLTEYDFAQAGTDKERLVEKFTAEIDDANNLKS